MMVPELPRKTHKHDFTEMPRFITDLREKGEENFKDKVKDKGLPGDGLWLPINSQEQTQFIQRGSGVLQSPSNNSERDLLWPPPPGAWRLGLGHLHHDVFLSPGTTRATDQQGPCQVHLEQRGVRTAAEVHSWGRVKVNRARTGLESPTSPCVHSSEGTRRNTRSAVPSTCPPARPTAPGARPLPPGVVALSRWSCASGVLWSNLHVASPVLLSSLLPPFASQHPRLQNEQTGQPVCIPKPSSKGSDHRDS